MESVCRSVNDQGKFTVTFLEHKVNGKSKGVCMVDFQGDALWSQRAREALSRIEWSGHLARVVHVAEEQIGQPPFALTPLDSLQRQIGVVVPAMPQSR